MQKIKKIRISHHTGRQPYHIIKEYILIELIPFPKTFDQLDKFFDGLVRYFVLEHHEDERKYYTSISVT